MSPAVTLPVRFALLATIALAPTLASASDGGDPYPMRWRIFRSYESQTAFRFPYDYRSPDQYAAKMVRGGGMGSAIKIDPATAKNPEKMKELVRKMRSQGLDQAAVVHKAATKGDLPGDVASDDHQAVLAHLAGRDYAAYEPFDYYGDVERRSHGDPAWAPEGIVALRGFSDDGCAQLLVHGDRYACLTLDGGIDEHDNRAILDTFEVMQVVRRSDPMTWREMMTIKEGEVFDAAGRPVKAKTAEPVDWADAWECETPNYHITCSASPRTTAQVGALMEALHAAYSGVFKPETVPPYKMEIHILPTVEEFARIAGAKGFGPVQTGRGGSLTGGFFVPSQLCIYSFEKPVRGFPTRMDRVLAHEASHQFLHVTCNGSAHVPTWINEGLAVYFESGTFKNGKFRWAPPKQRLNQLRQLYARMERTLQPLDKYLDHHGHIPASNYAEVYVMTHFWVFGAKGGKERFRDYWHALKAGEDGSEAFERIFMEDMIEAQGSRRQAVELWQKMLVEYLLSGAPHKAG